MSTAKTNSRRPRSPLDRERYTAELSTTQLVIGVCILLMFGLGCFLLGVLIGKFDPSLRDQMAQVLPDEPETVPNPIDDRGAAPKTTRGILNGTVNIEDRPPHNLLKEPAAQPLESVTSGTTTLPPSAQPSEAATGTPTSTAAVAQSSVPGSSASAEPPPAEPSRPEPAVTAPPLQPSAAVAPPPAQAQPPAPAASTQGIYGVQIIAASRPRAETVKRDIESRSPYKAEVIAIDGDRLCKVVVGRFQDERSALAARNDLRTKYPFKDAFVISLK